MAWRRFSLKKLRLARSAVYGFVERVARLEVDSRLEETVSSEPVSERRKFPLAGKIQGILFVWASEGGYWLRNAGPNTILQGRIKFPVPMRRCRREMSFTFRRGSNRHIH